MLSQEIDRRQCFERGNVARTGHHHIGFSAVVSTYPLPNADTSSAVFDGRLHVEPLQCGLLAGDDHIDIMAAPQTMIGDRKQAIGVGRTQGMGLRAVDKVRFARGTTWKSPQSPLLQFPSLGIYKSNLLGSPGGNLLL